LANIKVADMKDRTVAILFAESGAFTGAREGHALLLADAIDLDAVETRRCGMAIIFAADDTLAAPSAVTVTGFEHQASASISVALVIRGARRTDIFFLEAIAQAGVAVIL
tara:strand:- start:707 stop:1036 length:330 start_codon:yes stop_codon:yes gene_type:complete